MRQPPPSLKDLVGKALWATGRAANMQWFQFGRRRTIRSSLPSRRDQDREVGELALHVQSPWRLRSGTAVVVGSYDRNFPSGVCQVSKVPADFDRDRGATRLDELLDDLQKRLLPAQVTDIVAGIAGSFTLSLGDRVSIDVFPNASVESEHWRLFAPGEDDREHLVHESGPNASYPEVPDRSGGTGPNGSVYTAAHASVRFMGDSLDPLDVTRLLRLPSDHAHRNGEPRIRRRRDGTIREYAPYRQGMWSMSSETWVSSKDLNAHVEWLLEQLEPRKAEVLRLMEAGTVADIYCYSAGRTQETPDIPPDTASRCAALSISIDIAHYALDEDE